MPGEGAAPESDAEAETPSEAEAEAPVAAGDESSEAPEAQDIRLQVVAFVAAKGPTAIPQIQARFGLAFGEAGQLLAKLEAARLIQISGDPGAELVNVTPQGQELA